MEPEKRRGEHGGKPCNRKTMTVYRETRKKEGRGEEIAERMKQKAIKRRLMACLLLVCVLFPGCGIDLRNYIYTEASLKRVAAKSLKEKYGEEFVIYRAWDKSQEMFFVECSPKDDPEVVFKADIRKNGNGVVSDGYTQGVIAKELDEILRDDFHELFGDCYTKVMLPNYYNVPEFDNPSGVTLKEYLEQAHVDYMSYYVFILSTDISAESVNEEYKLFSEEVQKKVEKGIIPELVIALYFCNEEMIKNAEDYFSTRTTYDSIFEEELKKFHRVGFGYNEKKINKSYEEYETLRKGVD